MMLRLPYGAWCCLYVIKYGVCKIQKKTPQKTHSCAIHIEEDCIHKNGPLPHPRLTMSVLHFTQV